MLVTTVPPVRAAHSPGRSRLASTAPPHAFTEEGRPPAAERDVEIALDELARDVAAAEATLVFGNAESPPSPAVAAGIDRGGGGVGYAGRADDAERQPACVPLRPAAAAYALHGCAIAMVAPGPTPSIPIRVFSPECIAVAVPALSGTCALVL